MLHLDFSGGQAVKTVLSQHGAGVRSLVREFPQATRCGQKEKNKQTNKGCLGKHALTTLWIR